MQATKYTDINARGKNEYGSSDSLGGRLPSEGAAVCAGVELSGRSAMKPTMLAVLHLNTVGGLSEATGCKEVMRKKGQPDVLNIRQLWLWLQTDNKPNLFSN